MSPSKTVKGRRAELLRMVGEQNARIESSLWRAAWAELISARLSEEKAEAFFTELRNQAAQTKASGVRISEGRRVFRYSLVNAEAALKLLSEPNYHRAISKIPPLTRGRYSLSPARTLRNEITSMLEGMTVENLGRLAAWMKSNT